jgi:hypothetical protein
MKETIARQNETITRLARIARQDERIARQEETSKSFNFISFFLFVVNQLRAEIAHVLSIVMAQDREIKSLRRLTGSINKAIKIFFSKKPNNLKLVAEVEPYVVASFKKINSLDQSKNHRRQCTN